MTQTKQHHSELLQLQTNAEETNSNKESSPLIEREQIPNTPFWLIGTQEEGYHIIMGKYRLTNEPIFVDVHFRYVMDELIHDHLNAMKWNYILSIALIAITETPNIIKPN